MSKKSSSTTPPKAANTQTPALAMEADLLSRAVEAAAELGVAGEGRLIKALYLQMTSRLLTHPISLAIKGTSSSGKSAVVDAVIKLGPPEVFIIRTSVSPKALAYTKEMLDGRIFVLREASSLMNRDTAYFFRTLLSEHEVVHEVAIQGRSGEYQTQKATSAGKVGLLVTTTAAALDGELETRLLSLTTDDSPAQTRRILRAAAKRHGRAAQVDLGAWHELQRWLALTYRPVWVPYKRQLAELISPFAQRMRRDYELLLSFIEASALLHKQTRRRSTKGSIVATLDDYRAAYSLLAEPMANQAGMSVDPLVRATVEAVATLEKKTGPFARGINGQQIAKEVGRHASTAIRRAHVATRLGYLRNLERQPYRPGRWVTEAEMELDQPVLPTPKTLATTLSRRSSR